MRHINPRPAPAYHLTVYEAPAGGYHASLQDDSRRIIWRSSALPSFAAVVRLAEAHVEALNMEEEDACPERLADAI